MDEELWLSERFEDHRGRLQAVAYRMLGSLAEAEDAVQDAWVRVSRAEAGEVENLGAWLTTIVARVCLNMLRTRNLHREDPSGIRIPDPLVTMPSAADPAEQALLADSVGLALLVVLDTLAPAERLAFVLHDMFDVPFEEIAPMIGRSPAAARQVASRARRRVKGADLPAPDLDLARQQEVVDGFFAAVREGDFAALVRVLDPEVVLRIDAGPGRERASRVVCGAIAVATEASEGLASALARPATRLLSAVVNGGAGIVVTVGGRPVTVIGFTISEGLIAEIDGIADPDRVPAIAADLVDVTTKGDSGK
jgi:RNA polymerase sigma-70 factor (ECF subfamily)